MMSQLLSAILSEQHSLAFYTALSKQCPIFAPFVQTENEQLEALHFWAAQNGLEIPTHTISPNVPAGELACFEHALACENAKVIFYNQLATLEKDMALRNLFYQIAAKSNNEHLPAIRNALAPLYATSTKDLLSNLQTSKEWLLNAQSLLQDAQTGNLSEEKLGGFLSGLNYPLLGGVLLGGVSVALLNHFLNPNNPNVDKE